ncbi:fumarate hydratase [Mucilaginibacter pallidiroseus]|uniref:Fumarate hydratase n=1 Tax=Mucilaginibacter pallidiroseus TaxID=2599295 RepID=A0A563UEJ2_9SPHI|nr:fumarate hydratase [Mucilaginibacter pallidiroseus]TWR29703.1 fumarate hydratase [Mucilaginibacter pallidiroseus]
MQGSGQAYLQGEWLQDTSALQKRLVTYSLYNLKFTCDSFFVGMQSYTSVNHGDDSCVVNGRWAEYAKGVYEQKNDTIHLKGLFSNANGSYKVPNGCFRSGVYEEFFKVSKLTDSTLRFSPTSSVIPFNTHLVKRYTCNPKPL